MLPLESTPWQISWDEIEEFDRFDERRSAVDCLFINTIGVNDGLVEWCPNGDPPDLEERLAWIWCIQPSAGKEILTLAQSELRHLVESYVADEMDKWWRETSA